MNLSKRCVLRSLYSQSLLRASSTPHAEPASVAQLGSHGQAPHTPVLLNQVLKTFQQTELQVPVGRAAACMLFILAGCLRGSSANVNTQRCTGVRGLHAWRRWPC
jgi:hypothetical protein